MGTNLLIGCLLLLVSIFIHALATRFVMLIAAKRVASGDIKIKSKELWTAIIVLIMFAASFIQALAWAFTYISLGAIQSIEEALYFSIVTFTTLGYGDVTLNESYRLLASIEAAVGIIIFGWSTAVTMAVVQKFFFRSNKS